ncbi:MAG: VanW family protein [Lachnospiraceae bacterium]|nr:VanW family protein [Lachnospiraceae bacterium]
MNILKGIIRVLIMTAVISLAFELVLCSNVRADDILTMPADDILSMPAPESTYASTNQGPFAYPVETLNSIGINTKLSEVSTKYNVNQDRARNIETATAYLNGTIIPAGQIMSYNAVVGPRTVARGFGPGNIISGGKYVKGIGGGICQVSSTLNAAVLNAGIIPIERHNHSSCVHYLGSGLDATISGSKLDYKFINPYAYPLYIDAKATGGVLTIALYGNAAATGGIAYRPAVVGGSRKNTTYVVGYLNGIEVSRLKAYSSAYK